MKTVVAVSGYFNPLHPGHLLYFQKAKDLGDILVAIVNNDLQVSLKKSETFMTEDERLEIVRSIKEIDFALLAVDTDSSVSQSLIYLRPHIFAKGGDRTISNIPASEVDACKQYNIRIIDSICQTGGSSTELKKRLINAHK